MKVLVTGSNGLIGSAIKRQGQNSQHEFVCVNRSHGDLTKEDHVRKIFEEFKPDYVVNAAATVGGIIGNQNHHGTYFYNNILINTFLTHYCHLFNVKKFLNLSSTCVFPVKYETFDETMLHDGPPFDSHFAYAYAKRMIDVQFRAYKKQYGVKNYCVIIPGNVFGPNDSFNMQNGHVTASIMHKCLLAKKNSEPFVIWGDGSSKRDFIYSFDLADIIIQLLDVEELPTNLLVSSDTELSIKDLVEILVEKADFTGEVVWDTEKPNGQHRKKSNNALLHSMLPNLHFTNISDALEQTYKWLENNYPNVRL